MDGLYNKALAWLLDEIRRLGGIDKVTDILGASRSSLYRIAKGEQKPGADKLLSWVERLGAEIIFPGDVQKSQARDIEFINPKIVSAENGAPPPVGQDYFAIPLAASPVAAGPGRINEDQLKGWVVVWRHHDSIRFRTDLVAVEIGKGETSMVPHLHPGDIVLVDRADRRPDVDGKIMLVCDPDGGCAIKRVSSRSVDGDTELVFYSDNAPTNPPRVFRLNRDYGGELQTAIGGRVVWAWSDMTRK